jgi:hypothetical protein
MGKTIDYFKPWMNNSITYKGKLSDDGMSVIYASEGELLDCYIVGQTLLITNNKGKEVISLQQIYLDGEDTKVQAINHEGIIIINSIKRIIQKIEPFYDEDGNMDLVVVYL